MMPWQPSLIQYAAFERHRVVQDAARAAGACWPCCWEAGMRATDATVPREKVGEMHAECRKRIERSR